MNKIESYLLTLSDFYVPMSVDSIINFEAIFKRIVEESKALKNKSIQEFANKIEGNFRIRSSVNMKYGADNIKRFIDKHQAAGDLPDMILSQNSYREYISHLKLAVENIEQLNSYINESYNTVIDRYIDVYKKDCDELSSQDIRIIKLNIEVKYLKDATKCVEKLMEDVVEDYRDLKNMNKVRTILPFVILAIHGCYLNSNENRFDKHTGHIIMDFITKTMPTVKINFHIGELFYYYLTKYLEYLEYLKNNNADVQEDLKTSSVFVLKTEEEIKNEEELFNSVVEGKVPLNLIDFDPLNNENFQYITMKDYEEYSQFEDASPLSEETRNKLTNLYSNNIIYTGLLLRNISSNNIETLQRVNYIPLFNFRTLPQLLDENKAYSTYCSAEYLENILTGHITNTFDEETIRMYIRIHGEGNVYMNEVEKLNRYILDFKSANLLDKKEFQRLSNIIHNIIALINNLIEKEEKERSDL